MELGWDLIDQTVLDVKLLLVNKSDIWIHTLLYHFSSLATNSTVSNPGTPMKSCPSGKAEVFPEGGLKFKPNCALWSCASPKKTFQARGAGHYKKLTLP